MRVVLDFGSTNTGLTPTLSVWQQLDTFSDVVSPPTLTEIAAIPGMYWFDWAPGPTDPDMVYIADAGAGAPDATNRYRRGELKVRDSFLDASIAGVKSDLTALSAKVDVLTTSVSGVQLSATGIDGKVDTITSDVAAVKTELDTVASDAAAAKTNTDGLSTIVSATEAAAEALQTTADDHTEKLVTLKTAVDAILPAVQGVDTKLGSGNVGTALTAIQSAVTSLAASIDVTPLVTAVAAMQATVSGMNTTIAGVDTEVGNMVTTVSAFAAALQRALGMLHENSVLDKCVYTDNNDLRSARLRVYDSKDHSNAAAAALPDDYDTGKLAEYLIKASYSGANLTTYLMTREFPLT
jgi:hypothetical protein